jgi:hypothetical protein
MFDFIFHADWSCEADKRWAAAAHRNSKGWIVSTPQPLRDNGDTLGLIYLAQRQRRRALFGFDFPIGIPRAYGTQTQFTGFDEALSQFGHGEWKHFFNVTDDPNDVSLVRPFYPSTSRAGRRHADLCGPLNVASIDELRRTCERKTPHRPAACPLFWTLGGSQVGKAAIDGWQNIIVPALALGASLWPFDGRLEKLSELRGSVLCETYPREAYAHLGILFRANESKKNQEHRRRVLSNIIVWAREKTITFAPTAEAQVLDGFGPSKFGEDAFDAFVGLLSMIDVVDGRRPERGEGVNRRANLTPDRLPILTPLSGVA